MAASFLDRHPFATLVNQPADEPFVSHLPLLHDPGEGAAGRLVGHLARANPQVRALREQSLALAIFHGPHAYVSPQWYAQQPDVPTWNYAVAHVSGRVRIREDRAWLNQLLDRMLARFEAAGAAAAGAADLAHRERLLPGIVGLEMEIDTLQLKFKLGQNRSAEDRAGAARALLASDDQSARQTGEMMQATIQTQRRPI